MIVVECGECSRSYKLKPQLHGKRVKCKECGAAITVPPAPPRQPREPPSQPELIDEPRPVKNNKRRKKKQKRSRSNEGVPAFVQLAGNVFSIEVVLVMLLQLTIVLKSANEAGGAAFLVIIVLFVLSPLIFFIGRLFYRIGVGFAEGRRSGLYWFVIIIGLRVIYFASVGTELFEAQQGVLIMGVQIMLVALVLFLYVPAAAIAINNQREYTW